MTSKELLDFDFPLRSKETNLLKLLDLHFPIEFCEKLEKEINNEIFLIKYKDVNHIYGKLKDGHLLFAIPSGKKEIHDLRKTPYATQLKKIASTFNMEYKGNLSCFKALLKKPQQIWPKVSP
jgi:hypothetical protein